MGPVRPQDATTYSFKSEYPYHQQLLGPTWCTWYRGLCLKPLMHSELKHSSRHFFEPIVSMVLDHSSIILQFLGYDISKYVTIEYLCRLVKSIHCCNAENIVLRNRHVQATQLDIIQLLPQIGHKESEQIFKSRSDSSDLA